MVIKSGTVCTAVNIEVKFFLCNRKSTLLKIYFNTYQNRKNLKKMGFINNHGFINPDPDYRFLGGPLKNKNLKKN